MQRSRALRRSSSRTASSRLRAGARAFGMNVRNAALCRAQLSFGAMWASEWCATVAVSVVAYRDGGAPAVALVAVVRMLPGALVAPFAATLADRHRRDHVLACVGLVRATTLAAAAALLIAGAPSAAVYAPIAAATLAQTLYRPAHSALLSALCRTPEELTSANVVRGLLDSLATLLGPLGAAGLIVVGGAQAALAACALASLASALLLTGLRYDPPPRAARAAGTDARAVMQGFAAIAGDRGGLLLVTGLGIAQTFTRGALNVLSVVVAIDLLDSGEAGVGVLNAAVGAGAVLGSILTFRLLRRGGLAMWLGLGVALWGLPLIVLGAVPERLAAIALVAVIGFGNALIDAGGFTLLARLADETVLARMFAAFEAILTFGTAVGALLTPLVIDLVGIRSALVAVGLVAPVAVAARWAALRRLDARMRVRDADIAVLHQVAVLRSLPQSTIEHLAASLQRVVFAPGATVLQDGSFYIVTAGRADVTRGSGHIAQLGPGSCFGEMIEPLPSDLPHTATVRATHDTALHVGVLAADRLVAAVAALASSAKLAEQPARLPLRAALTAA
jgi:Major Facilitator Superfamily